MNPIIDAIIHRCSIRSYRSELVPADVRDAVLRAGCAAPYGGPEEPWRFLVIEQADLKRRLLAGLKLGIDRACGGPPPDGYWCSFFAEAPLLIAVAFKPTSMGGHPPRTEDAIGIASAACAIENMLLAAVSEGLGACWVGPLWEAKQEFEQILRLEPPWEFLAFVTAGYTNKELRRPSPKPFGKMVQYIDAQHAGGG